MEKVAVLPLDDRPVNYDYPRYLARSAGIDILLPEREWLGNPWRSSQHKKLVDWLEKTAPEVDGLILAVDTLAFGGLIPSRTSYDSVETILRRLAFLRQLKQSRPDLPILASSVILRICRNNSSEEEKPYWATYGANMFRLSYLEHKGDLFEATGEELEEKEHLRGQIPDEIYNDYRQGRARNHAINMAMIDFVADGVFDYLVLPQDDTMDYGWNIAEARKLQLTIRQRGLTEKAITYPGADEIGSLLLAAFVCHRSGFSPKVWPRYSSTNSPGVVTAYEDRPFNEMIKAHLAPLGGILANSIEDSDLLLYINAPAKRQGDSYLQWYVWEGIEEIAKKIPQNYQAFLNQVASQRGMRVTKDEMQSPYRNPEEFVQSMIMNIIQNKEVAVADVAFVNGMDVILGSEMVRHPEVARLASVGGWNTAGNTLGTVLAQAVIHILSRRGTPTPDQVAAHLEFLFLRFLDDYYYQGIERTRCLLEDFTALGLPIHGDHMDDPGQLAIIQDRVRNRLNRAAHELRQLFISSGLVKDVIVSDIYLPWQRMFEVGFDVKVSLS